MKIIIPAMNEKENVKYFEIQCLVKKNQNSEVLITGLVDESIVDTIHTFVSILEFNVLGLGGKIKNKKIHFHFTEGSFVKEGTSVGLGIALAYLNAINKSIFTNGIILATGEIDLYGNVCEVGGVESKLKKNNYDYAIIPKANYKLEYGKRVIGMSHLKELIK